MSGYLSDLVSEVETRDDTTLVQMDDADAQEDVEWADDEPPIAVDEIVSFFRRKGLGNRDYVVIPAHEPDEPTFNGDIITYRTTDYGAVFITTMVYQPQGTLNSMISVVPPSRAGFGSGIEDTNFPLENSEIRQMIGHPTETSQ
ncbi:hypothetical protein ACFSBT_14170 [Halomarina rubra]|uniref:Uncharacterized protein n=2 Tax=Halomarina rubra TaxID=2071873 RepID=A0ABD6B011_9EURY